MLCDNRYVLKPHATSAYPKMQPLLMATDGLRVQNGISRQRQREVSGYCTNSTITESRDTSLTCPSHHPKGWSILAFHCTSIYSPGLKGDTGSLYWSDAAQSPVSTPKFCMAQGSSLVQLSLSHDPRESWLLECE